MNKKIKLGEIAEKIYAHLKKFERNPKINIINKISKTKPYYHTSAISSGSKIFVTYIHFQGHSSLTKGEALEYLQWLDNGNIGTHFKMGREKNGKK